MCNSVLPFHSRKPAVLVLPPIGPSVRHAKPLSLGESVELNAGGHYVAVTFDDGFENFVGEALPELVKRKVPAAMFVIVGALDKSFGRADHSERVMRSN